MRDEIAALPREYLQVLRELVADPEIAKALPPETGSLVEQQWAVRQAARHPNPRDAAMHRLCTDPGARAREVEARTNAMVDDWIDDPVNSRARMTGVPREVVDGLRAAAERELFVELADWRRRYPDVPLL